MQLTGKKILVTGGAGFLGSHLCERLIREGAQVAVLDIFDSGRMANIMPFRDQVELFSGDMADEKMIFAAGAGREAVIHTAIPLAIRQQKFSFAQWETAVKGFFHILQLCLAEDAVLVDISSVSVYGNPQYHPVDENHPLEPETVYGALKVSEEYYCRTLAKTAGLKTVILRVADIYGPRNTRLSVPINFLLKGMKNLPITVFGDGTQGRSYTFVSDFVEAAVLALAREKVGGEVFNVAGERYVSMLELAEAVRAVTGGGTVVLDPDGSADTRRLDIDIARAGTELGFQPAVPLKTGLEKTLEWMRYHQDYWG